MARHARFSPSAASRRLNCPPSLALEEQFDEEESQYAAEGTAGHALAEHLIKKHLKIRTKRPVSDYYSDDLLEAVDEYVSFVIGEIEDARRECKTPVICVEQRVDASDYVDECFGTADAVIVTDKVAHVIDLKLGKGVPVYAEENPQLMIYGLGVLSMAELLYDVETVRLTVFQPRLNSSSTWDVTPSVLKKWGEEVLRPRGTMALMGAGEFSAGAWCRFCRARNQCRARADEFLKLAQMEFRAPALLSDEEIAEVLRKSDELAKWASDVYAFAQDRQLSTERCGPAISSSRVAPTASTHPTRKSQKRQRPQDTATSTSIPSLASARWKSSWAKMTSPVSSDILSTSPRGKSPWPRTPINVSPSQKQPLLRNLRRFDYEHQYQ